MEKSLARQLFEKIAGRLLNSDWLAKHGIPERLVKKHLESSSFMHKIEAMVSNQDYTCQRVFSLCQNIFQELAGQNSPPDGLNFIYRYARGKAFPHTVDFSVPQGVNLACSLYLEALKAVSELQRTGEDGIRKSKYPLDFLTSEEENSLEDPGEYRRFLEAFHQDYVYEMMKLNQEVLGFNSLDHICGVHFLSLFIGRQLAGLGQPIDLGRVSGAAAGHDIGKFACRGMEMKRVPYLHYYYTGEWFRRHKITYIGHIAGNHSTWDLELENLSLESLILIYADFRVKARGEEMNIYSLADSFDVILQKLDNVDQAKEKRYRRVYAKLKDFEDYLIFLGLNVEPDQVGKPPAPEEKIDYSLLQGPEMIQHVKYLAISHNISLMYRLRDEFSLNSVLEMARSENDWRNLRTYLRIFEEYSAYLTQKQKLNTIKFLYEQLIHPEDDIRRQCAELIGILISLFDEKYRKEVPEGASLPKPELASLELFDQYLRLFFLPDHKIIPLHRTWIWYSGGAMIRSLFQHCSPAKTKDYRSVLLKYYQKNGDKDREFELYLIDAAKYIPITDDDPSLHVLSDYLFQMLNSGQTALRLCAWETTYDLMLSLDKDSVFCQKLAKSMTERPVYSRFAPENFLKWKTAKSLGLDDFTLEKYYNFYILDLPKIQDIFLSNLKTAVDWITKKIQVEILLEYALENPRVEALHTAMHFCNLLKSSVVDSVRNQAGEALVRIVPFLSLEQRNDVVVELLRALEIRGYQFSEIPYFLGRLLISLQPVELDEMINGFKEQIKQPNAKLIYLLLRTVGSAIESYPKYREAFPEIESTFQDRLIKMLGILLNGLGNYNMQIKQMAFSVIGKEIFGSRRLTLAEKHHIFTLIIKKVLTLLTQDQKQTLMFLTNAAGLNHIYRFVSDYIFFHGEIALKIPEKVAFFPGAFDPYSLSHKEITRTIRDLGFEVYLQTDEFSWSKLTLPNTLRRNIIKMSIADELGIYLYPEDHPANIAHPADLRLLRKNFPRSEVYMVVGSDVILNASAYRASGGEDSIYHFPHVVFERKNAIVPDDVEQGLDEALKKITGHIIKLALAPQYEDISSTQIRNYIDENRDISSLVDPLVQQYIYDNGFYRREPQYKTLIGTISIKVDLIKHYTARIEQELSLLFPGKEQHQAVKKLRELARNFSAKILAIRDVHRKGAILGFSVFHSVRAPDFYAEFKNSRISEYIREKAVGRIVIIDGIFVLDTAAVDNLEQMILNETLTFCLGDDYHYAVFKNVIEDHELVHETLERHGFQRFSEPGGANPVFMVNMNSPCTFMLNVEAIIKEPLRSNPRVKAAVGRARKRLQQALTMLYPGNLVLTYDMNMIHEVLIQKICDENGVSPVPSVPRTVGPAMCVAFGNILNRYMVPNTVTKALHTEKYYQPDITSFTIQGFPHYLSLENQMKMLRSFNRPVILVDDLLHKGYRIKALDPLLKKEKIQVQKIFVGVLSGRGKELMDVQNRKVDGAYFIPKLKAWFNEDILYPFMGGDTLWRGVHPERNLLPSVNLILPYMFPYYIKGTSYRAVYHLSEVCIENAIDILTVLEQEYLTIHGRALTLGSLGEVFIAPRCPDQGKDMDYNLKLSPAGYLQNDLELLRRMEQFVAGTGTGQDPGTDQHDD